MMKHEIRCLDCDRRLGSLDFLRTPEVSKHTSAIARRRGRAKAQLTDEDLEPARALVRAQQAERLARHPERWECPCGAVQWVVGDPGAPLGRRVERQAAARAVGGVGGHGHDQPHAHGLLA